MKARVTRFGSMHHEWVQLPRNSKVGAWIVDYATKTWPEDKGEPDQVLVYRHGHIVAAWHLDLDTGYFTRDR